MKYCVQFAPNDFAAFYFKNKDIKLKLNIGKCNLMRRTFLLQNDIGLISDVSFLQLYVIFLYKVSYIPFVNLLK